MIRVLHCVAGLQRGGYETLLMNVYRKLDRQKVQFDFLYSFDGVFNQEILDLGGRIYQIPFITQAGPFVYRRAVMNFFREHPEYTIVHSHMDKFSGLIMDCAKRNGIPVRIAHSHGVKNEGGILFDLVKNYYGRMVLPNCTHKFACSAQSARFLFGETGDVRFFKNGVDTARFCCRDRREPDTFTIVQVGRFSPVKNQPFMLDVFRTVLAREPRARLIFAGSGKGLAPAREKADRLGMSRRVTFLGDWEDIPGLLAGADVLCMPSLHEAFGLTLVETQSVGVPCVLSDTISEECKIVEDVTFLSLQAGTDVWAETLLRYKGAPRRNNRALIQAAGYDISNTATVLQDFYLSQAAPEEEAPAYASV